MDSRLLARAFRGRPATAQSRGRQERAAASSRYCRASSNSTAMPSWCSTSQWMKSAKRTIDSAAHPGTSPSGSKSRASSATSRKPTSVACSACIRWFRRPKSSAFPSSNASCAAPLPPTRSSPRPPKSASSLPPWIATSRRVPRPTRGRPRTCAKASRAGVRLGPWRDWWKPSATSITGWRRILAESRQVIDCYAGWASAHRAQTFRASVENRESACPLVNASYATILLDPASLLRVTRTLAFLRKPAPV